MGLVITSWTGIWWDGALPYNTPNLGGWQCNAKFHMRNHWQPEIEWDELNRLIWMYPSCPPPTYPVNGADTCPDNPQFWVRTQTKTTTAVGGCCDVPSPPPHVGEPINASSGNVYQTEHDSAEQGPNHRLLLNRFYNSLDSGAQDLGAGWRHGFSRKIAAVRDVSSYLPYVSGDANSSALYQTAALACTTGFAQIQSQVPNWSGASATYTNDVCALSKNGVSIGTLPILFAYPQLPPPRSSVLGFNVTRDDGSVIWFANQGGAVLTAPGTTLRLQQTATGYTLADAKDAVETYDSNGALQIITSRSGGFQTMSYDSSGRLSTVADNFGHQLTLSYDAQNRVISVTRQ